MSKIKKVLVTGAAGFIGSNLVERLLLETDYTVYAMDNLQGGSKIYNTTIVSLLDKYGSRLHFVLENVKCINDLLSQEGEFDTVFHFAANPSVPYSVEHPVLTNDNNVTNSLILLDWCVKFKVKRFVFSSSSAIYGDVSIFPTSETSEISPKSPYALQKRIIEEYCKLYSELYGLDTVCLRYFNVYGTNQYSDNAYSNVICAWIKGAVSGTNIRMDGTGDQCRDFVFVDDVCQANMLVANCETPFFGDIFNVGSGEVVSLNEILCMIELNAKIKGIDYKDSRMGDAFKTHADIEKISKFGYKPSMRISDGIVATYNWYLGV